MNYSRGDTTDAGAVAVADPDVNEVAERVLEVLPRVIRRVRARMGRERPGDLTVVQLRALRYLGRHPGTGLSALAEHLEISMPGASGLLDRLVRAGLVVRADDPVERRRLHLVLTETGTAQLEDAQRHVRGWLVDQLQALGPGPVLQVSSALDVLDRLTAVADGEVASG